ncbi:hypothetical protein ASPTUDRAFT_560958 [Aspergillus tubingensis CBS 134.48]|uniref:Uncharacterized protein n=1 Tax=Aspergillus tubingensis (strain CBS 134.48) TaxID=767770 RepID=A0A1L9N7W0_ASPTC|nr:hypothetical protein ASPTUDRAFT_560958 [Aspergillus tubingensis CBS 134.48]
MVGWVGVDWCLLGFVLHALLKGQQNSQQPAAGTPIPVQCLLCDRSGRDSSFFPLFSTFLGEATGIIGQNLINSQEKFTEHLEAGSTLNVAEQGPFMSQLLHSPPVLRSIPVSSASMQDTANSYQLWFPFAGGRVESVL